MVNTFICPIIRTDLIERCLETVYKYTDDFYFYIIDQSIEGLDATRLRNQYKNLMIIRTPKTDTHKQGNLGFAKATNLGIQLVETPYLTMINDDVEMISKEWFSQVLATFDKVDKATPERPCLSVTPSSVKLPDWSLGRDSGDDFYIMEYKKEYTQADWDWLINEPHYLNEHLTLQPGSVIDGITLYCSVFRTAKLLEVGLLDEKYYPGKCEDYDLCCRTNMLGYRCVGTTMSYVFHHWSSSFKSVVEASAIRDTIDDDLRCEDLREVWGVDDKDVPWHDLWGVKCRVCEKPMVTDDGKKAYCKEHPAQTYDIPPLTITPL